MTPTLWPQDMPFPPDEGKEEVASTFGDGDANSQQPGDRSCFSPNSMQYPAYFKDAKGMNHSVFGTGTSFGALQYLKQGGGGVGGGKGCLPDVIQHGRSAGKKKHNSKQSNPVPVSSTLHVRHLLNFLATYEFVPTFLYTLQADRPCVNEKKINRSSDSWCTWFVLFCRHASVRAVSDLSEGVQTEIHITPARMYSYRITSVSVSRVR